MAKKEKTFNTKIYAIIVFFLMAGILTAVTVATYKSKYTGFSPEKVALAYTESIVNRGDGYNAYKNTVISKNYKYGDFIREFYMYPVIYRDTSYTVDHKTEGIKGYNDDSFIGEMTATDTGTLQGQVIDTMYPYYVQLIEENNGWDNYDTIFTKYFDKLVEVREEIFGDKYMTDEIMFTALEANVSTYGDSLTGTEEKFDSNTGVKISDETIGVYEKAFGEDAKLICKVKTIKAIENLDEYLANMDTVAINTIDIYAEDIEDAKICTIDVTANGNTVVDSLEIPVLKIKDTWYVDNTNVDTSELYSFYK